jgi:putative Ca2+/H+ antiporter (TMEM165/GDT1 family)
MTLTIAASVFPIIFLGELPDKSTLASLVLASRGRPLAVWTGAAIAFTAHVAIAVSVGVAIFELLPRRVVDGLVASLFLAGAVYAFAIRHQQPEAVAAEAAPGSFLRMAARAAAIVFIAEWGDLTQVLITNMAAHYHSPLSVGAGALLALWAVAGLAVVSGKQIVRLVPITTARLVTAAVLLVLAAWSAVGALGL